MSGTRLGHLGSRDELMRFRIVKLGRFVTASASNQHSSVAEKRRGVSGPTLIHFRPGAHRLPQFVEDFAGVNSAASLKRTTAGDQTRPSPISVAV